MQSNLFERKTKRAYIIYRLDTEVEIEMICNPNTELEKRCLVKCVYQFEINPTFYLFVADMPDSNYLRDKNTVIFEITYCPQPLHAVSFYSDRYAFNLEDELGHYFMIGMKFRRNERNILFVNPPGRPVDNLIVELVYFYYYISDSYLTNLKKLKAQSADGSLLINSCNQLACLLGIFKNSNASFANNPKLVKDYLDLIDDFTLAAEKSKEFTEIFLFLVAMYGIFPYDLFTTREFPAKQAILLMNYMCGMKLEMIEQVMQKVDDKFRPILANGFYVLINNAIKEGATMWLQLTKGKKGLKLIFQNEEQFAERISEFIRKSGTSCKSKESFEDLKNFIFSGRFINSSENFDKIDNGKTQTNSNPNPNNLFRNIAIVSMSKENLLDTLFEFCGMEEKILDSEKIKILREEIKRKKWGFDTRSNMTTYIIRLKKILETERIFQIEFRTLLYDVSSSIKYLFTLLQLSNYNSDMIDMTLFKKSFNLIYEIPLEDYLIISNELHLVPKLIKKELIDSNFYDKIKSSVKSIIQAFPLDDYTKLVLRNLLLNSELFPTGSLDYIRDFVRNKPTFEDLVYICAQLILPQRRLHIKDSDRRKFNDIWLNVKNHINSSFNEINDLVKYFSLLFSSLAAVKTNVTDNYTEEDNLSFLKWFCMEVFKTLHQKYSIEIFFGLTHVLCLDDRGDKDINRDIISIPGSATHIKHHIIFVESYIDFIKKLIEQTPVDSANMYHKVNEYFAALSLAVLRKSDNPEETSEASESVLYSSNRTSEIIITCLLDFLQKNSHPEKISRNFIYENPTKECFWYRLINCVGDYTNFKSHAYLKNVLKILQENLKDITEGDITISDFILVSKQSINGRHTLFAYFDKISDTYMKREDEISEHLNIQLGLLKQNLKIVNQLETFFNSFSYLVKNSEDYIGCIKAMKENFKITKFKEFAIRSDISEIKHQIEIINSWNNTMIYRNIFEMEIAKEISSQDKTSSNQALSAKDLPKLELKDLLRILNLSQEEINKVLSTILFKEDFSKLTLSVTKKYFKGLTDYSKESDIIDKMISLQVDKKNILTSILRTFCEINSYINFSQSILKLDSIYNFSKNNSHKDIYSEFLQLIDNTDSSFDKIYQSSMKLAEIRQRYLEKRDIENILHELSESKELSDFLVNTPEEDIRNMVDAVDEHGDSFIRVQTIRDLLIIGSFVKSLNLKEFLLSTSDKPSEEDFIQRIHLAFKKSHFTAIDVLINSSMKQIAGIKHLHAELSNREEASKIKAKEVSKQSKFEFILNTKANKLGNEYEVLVSYGKSGKKINYKDLFDLRDRVLLLLYNEKGNDKGNDKVSENENNSNKENDTAGHQSAPNKKILSSFIKIVELTEKILHVLNDSYHNGYPAKLSQTIVMQDGNCANHEEYLFYITEINNNWNEDLKEAYTKYYPLTFFNGNQFWELERLFVKILNQKRSFGNDLSNLAELETSTGYFLLKFVNPSLTLSYVVESLNEYNELNELNFSQNEFSNFSLKERIKNLGEIVSKIIKQDDQNGSKYIENIQKVNLNLKNANIIYSSPSNLKIYTFLLSIHFSVENSLPSSNQIFYCRKDTTYHELISFLYRFIFCPNKRLFTLLKVENLNFQLQNFLVERINKLSRNKNINKNPLAILSILCCDQNSFLHTQFSENSQIFLLREFDILDEFLISNNLKSLNLNAFVIRSDDTGAGKTHYIKSKLKEDDMCYIDFPILDSIRIGHINEAFYKLISSNISQKKILFIHFTIGGIIDDYEILDYILFSLIVLGCLKHEIHVSFRNNSHPVYLEIANTFNDYLYNAISILPLMPYQEMIIARENLRNIDIIKDVKDPLQIIVNYLYNYDKDFLNETDIVPEINQNMKIFSREDCSYYLEKYFIKDSHDITFRQLTVFIAVLSDQLIKYSNNYFFSVENIGYIQDDSLKDIRQQIMNCLLIMTEEFTKRSIKSARDSQNLTVFKLKRSYSREDINDQEKRIEEYNSLSNILSWSSSNHLLIMFHEDGMCVTPVYRDASKVIAEVQQLVESQRHDLEDYQVFSHFELLEKILNIVGRQFVLDFLAKKTEYILTADNFLKMLLIIIRARCNVPIVIMGETGCGKTSLVRFLATEIMQEGFEVINFHAGVTGNHIVERMLEIISRAEMLKVTDNKIWVFLDEINTCDCMGLINEMICHKTMRGIKISENIVFIAACNPYKLRKITENEVGLVKQRAATRLVYTVHPLPDGLIDYVWDYGSLTDNEERLYIGNILNEISGEIKKTSIDAVCKSQIFLRNCEDKYSVSLRDVARFKIIHEWFYRTLLEKNDEKISSSGLKNEELGKITINKEFGGVIIKTSGYSREDIKYRGKLMVSRKALILSVILCYYNRISKNEDRLAYKKMIHNIVGITLSELDEMINEEQRDLLMRMELPPAIAINNALLENVFTLLVCIINKIPIFICGKPGCSKSLSVQLLVSNLRGQDSHDNFFKKLPRILAIPYQGSETSTSEGIEKIFEKAHNVLNNTHDSSILPLIVFDEIGLAEISKNNPLKVLHSLLEPERAEVAFVGISNWRLDASKMNRAVYLARPDPDLQDLENTALSIFEYYNKEPRFDERFIMKALAKTYYEFKLEQTQRGYPDFHGTRDFYSLIKQVTREFNSHSNYNNYNETKFKIIRNALMRNFGGLQDSIEKILNILAINLSDENVSYGSEFTYTIMDLIKENLQDKDSRFLLLFTNGESASYILDNYLKNDLRERVFMIGSEFEMDKDKDEHSFRLLSDIILYMESGNSIIVKNLDQIYGSLYDLFNQNFMIVGQKKNCRIALGSTNNPMCFVNNHFHCVVLVDLKDLHKMDPPFLNRFEKQILTFDSVLTLKQKELVNELNQWIKGITTMSTACDANQNYTQISPSDLIVSYNNEFSPSLVLTHYREALSNEEILEKCKRDILHVSSVSFIVYSVTSEMYQSKRDEVIKAHRIYFEEQCHDSINGYLEQTISQRQVSKENQENKLIVYTYSNILDEIDLPCVKTNSEVNLRDVNPTQSNGLIVEEESTAVNQNNLRKKESENYTVLNIAEIKSEKEFEQRFKLFLTNDKTDWLFIKFDILKEKNHIPIIKFKVDKMLYEYNKINLTKHKNIVMIIYLSRRISSTTEWKLESHFLSGWDQIMIDCLNGGQIDKLKNILDLSTLELIKQNLDQKSIAEMIFNIYLKFSFNTYNTKDMSFVKLYITESIHRIESDLEIFKLIFKKCLEYLEEREKDLGDWKLKICLDAKILSKSTNAFSAIKKVIEQVIEEPLLRIIYFLEAESAFASYFYTHSENSSKTKIFKQIWKEQFEKKDLNKIYTYNVAQSLNINCVFNLAFPFSKNDIYEISHAIAENVDRIYMYDNAAYNTNLSTTPDQELFTNFQIEVEKIKKIVRNSSIIFKILANYNARELETAYISDMVTYFLTIEIKKEFKWKNCLEIIVSKCVGFDVENLEFVFVFLWKNKKMFDAIFNIFNSLCENSENSQNTLVDSNFIERMLLDDGLELYDKRIGNFMNLQTRKDSEVKTFLNIFNVCSKILLSRLNANISNDYGVVLNNFISSLMNLRLEIKEAPDALNILIIVNEYLKVISTIYKNDVKEIGRRVKGILTADEKSNNEEENIDVDMNSNADSNCMKNKLDFNFKNLNLKDFRILQKILTTLDKEMEDLRHRQLNPDNFIKLSFVKNINNMVISSKLTIFENVIIGVCDLNTKFMIINNILKDDELCQNSSMIFYHLYQSEESTSGIKISEDLEAFLKSELKPIIEDYLERHNILINSVVCSFFSDFFRKFFYSPEKKEIVKYLSDNIPNYFKYLGLISNPTNTKYEQVVAFSGIKHYLELFAIYLVDDTVEKNEKLSLQINESLESNELFVEVLRNFCLKSMAAFFGGTANTLTNVDYKKLGINWVNNKLFENNDNALGIEPNLPEFEKLNKEFNLFFVSLLNEENEENIQKLKTIILNSAVQMEKRFILIQFFINKVWLSFTHPKYLTSYTYQYVLKIFEKVKDNIKLSLGEPVLNFIYNLINNFPKNKDLKITPTTDTNKIGMLTLAMQMLNMMLSIGKDLCISKLFINEKGEFYKDFGHWNAIFLPAGFVEYQDENLLVMMKHIGENYEIYGTQIGLYECMCGFLYTIGDCTRPYYVSQCPNCAGKIGGVGHVLEQGHKCLINADNRNNPDTKSSVIEYLSKKLKNNPGYIAKMADELSMHYSIRCLSSIGFRFLNFFSHSILYLLLEIGVIEQKALVNVFMFKDLKIKPGEYLSKHLFTDIIKLTDLIKSKEFYIFMHVIFNEFINLCKDPFRFDSAIEREKFEIAFQTKIIQPKLDKLAGEITEYKQFFNNEKKLTYLSIINENFSEDEIKTLSNYELFRAFRYTRLGNWEDLKNEFMKKKIPFQFLKLLIEKFDELTNLSECLYPVIQFTNYMLNLCNYKYTRAETKEVKIREIVQNNVTAENLFLDFARAWKKIAYKATQWQCKSLPVLDKVDLDLPLSFVLVDDRELGYGMYIAAAYQYLGRIQNEVLEAIVYLIRENNNYQIWGNMDTHKYSIQKISSHEIIMYQTDSDYIKMLTDNFSKFYDVFNPNYGQGSIVEYNFEKIENELAFKLLTNKKFLDYENINKIQYKFELLSIQGKNSNLLNDIKSTVNQCQLTPDDMKDCTKVLEKLESLNVANLHEIFSNLEIILCNLRYQNKSEENNITIANYVNKIQGGDKFSSYLRESPTISNLKLENILSFYSLVESKLFKHIVEFISPDYRNPIDEAVSIRILEFLVLAEKEPSRYPSPRLILNVIQRFIFRCLVATLEPKFPIKEYLNRVDFWELDTREEIIDNFYFDFPDELLIANTITLHSFVSDFISSTKGTGESENEYNLAEERKKFERQEFFKKR